MVLNVIDCDRTELGYFSVVELFYDLNQNGKAIVDKADLLRRNVLVLHVLVLPGFGLEDQLSSPIIVIVNQIQHPFVN